MSARITADTPARIFEWKCSCGNVQTTIFTHHWRQKDIQIQCRECSIWYIITVYATFGIIEKAD